MVPKMGRTLASFLVLAALGAAIITGRGFFDRLTAPEVPERLAIETDVTEPALEEAEPSAPEDTVVWSPVFGTPAPETPVIRVEPTPAPASFDFDLKGVIVSGETRWAILSGAGSDTLVQEGDVIGDARIVAIKPRGIEIEINGGTQSVAFSETAPIERAEVEVPEVVLEERSPALPGIAGEDDPRVQEVIFQGMSKERLQEILREAEKKRRERGWIVQSPD